MSNKEFKVNCSKMLIIMQIFSFTPNFALEDATNQSVGEQGRIHKDKHNA